MVSAAQGVPFNFPNVNVLFIAVLTEKAPFPGAFFLLIPLNCSSTVSGPDMVKIELLSSPDRLMLGTYEFFHRGFIVGSAPQCDLILQDLELDPIHLYLRSINKNLFSRSLLDGPGFFINGKKVRGNHPLHVEDIVGVGKSIFKIIAFTPPGADVEGKFSKIYGENLSSFPKLKELLKIIETEIIYLDKMESEFKE